MQKSLFHYSLVASERPGKLTRGIIMLHPEKDKKQYLFFKVLVRITRTKDKMSMNKDIISKKSIS